MEETQIDLKKMSVTELKALAYDVSAVLTNYRNYLNAVNQEILEKSKSEEIAKVEKPKSK